MLLLQVIIRHIQCQNRGARLQLIHQLAKAFRFNAVVWQIQILQTVALTHVVCQVEAALSTHFGIAQI